MVFENRALWTSEGRQHETQAHRVRTFFDVTVLGFNRFQQWGCGKMKYGLDLKLVGFYQFGGGAQWAKIMVHSTLICTMFPYQTEKG